MRLCQNTLVPLPHIQSQTLEEFSATCLLPTRCDDRFPLCDTTFAPDLGFGFPAPRPIEMRLTPSAPQTRVLNHMVRMYVVCNLEEKHLARYLKEEVHKKVSK